MTVLGIGSHTSDEPSMLRAGQTAELKPIRVKTAAGDLERGQIMALNTSTWLWESLAVSGSNGESVARAILAEDAANNTEGTTRAQAYFIGRYRYSDLKWAGEQTADQKRQALLELQDRGIIVDDAIHDAPPTTTTSTSTTTTTTTTTT